MAGKETPGKRWEAVPASVRPSPPRPQPALCQRPAPGGDGGQEQSAEPRPPPPPHGELQYLGQIEHILRCGFRRDDRTGTGTLSVFGMQARYNLRGEAAASWGRAGPVRAELRWGERCGQAGPSDGRLALTSAA